MTTDRFIVGARVIVAREFGAGSLVFVGTTGIVVGRQSAVQLTVHWDFEAEILPAEIHPAWLEVLP